MTPCWWQAQNKNFPDNNRTQQTGILRRRGSWTVCWLVLWGNCGENMCHRCSLGGAPKDIFNDLKVSDVLLYSVFSMSSLIQYFHPLDSMLQSSSVACFQTVTHCKTMMSDSCVCTVGTCSNKSHDGPGDTVQSMASTVLVVTSVKWSDWLNMETPAICWNICLQNVALNSRNTLHLTQSCSSVTEGKYPLRQD